MEAVAAAARIAIAEAKRKRKAKADDPDAVEDAPAGYKRSPKLDFSPPMGDRNFVKANGASNIGPWTGESAVRKMVREAVRREIAVLRGGNDDATILTRRSTADRRGRTTKR